MDNGYLHNITLINVRCIGLMNLKYECKRFGQSFKQHWKALIVFCYERITSAPRHAHNMVK